MPPNSHAILSASSSHRWMNCTPSARLEREFADRETEAAAEGTAAHALCEHKLRRALKMRSRKPVSKYDCDEMDAYTDGYVEFVLEQLTQAKLECADPLVLIEQRLDFSCWVPEGFGTGDCIIVADKLLHIIDFKYGQGVLVEAEENPQMMLYALGALRLFDSLYDITEVSMSIYQPRRENVSTWTISVDELNAWAENTLKPKAKLAHKGEGEYGGSVGALKSMGALEMGVSEDELKPLVDAWRASNPRIVQFWWDVDREVKRCVKERCATETHGLRFTYESGFLFITLPSGRRLA